MLKIISCLALVFCLSPVIASKEKLNREREKLELYKTEMQNLTAIAEINRPLAQIKKVS